MNKQPVLLNFWSDFTHSISHTAHNISHTVSHTAEKAAHTVSHTTQNTMTNMSKGAKSVTHKIWLDKIERQFTKRKKSS